MKSAATAAGAATNADLVGAQATGQAQAHEHQAVPSDVTLRDSVHLDLWDDYLERG